MYDEQYYEGNTSNYGTFGGYGSRKFELSRKVVNKKIISMIKAHKNDGRFLDIGCAYGFLTDSASRKGFDAQGIDISEFAVNEARKRYPGLDIQRMDIEKKMRLPDAEYDVVTAIDVLEHCKELKSVLSELKRIMKDDAVLLICVPDSDMLTEEKDNDDTHVWRMNANEWSGMFRKNGLAMIKTLVYPNWLRYFLPHWCSTLMLLKKSHA